MLGENAEFDGLAHLGATARGGNLAVKQAKERGLAGAVLAEDSVAVSGANEPVDVIDDSPALIVYASLLELEILLSKPAYGEALELEGVSQGWFVCDERPRRFDPELWLARASLGSTR